MPGMATSLGDDRGFVSERNIAYYEARAKGGAGLIIAGAVAIDYTRGRMHHGQLSLDDDKYIPEMSQQAESIKKHGTVAFVQLHHGGRSN